MQHLNVAAQRERRRARAARANQRRARALSRARICYELRRWDRDGYYVGCVRSTDIREVETVASVWFADIFYDKGGRLELRRAICWR